MAAAAGLGQECWGPCRQHRGGLGVMPLQGILAHGLTGALHCRFMVGCFAVLSLGNALRPDSFLTHQVAYAMWHPPGQWDCVRQSTSGWSGGWAWAFAG